MDGPPQGHGDPSCAAVGFRSSRSASTTTSRWMSFSPGSGMSIATAFRVCARPDFRSTATATKGGDDREHGGNMGGCHGRCHRAWLSRHRGCRARVVASLNAALWGPIQMAVTLKFPSHGERKHRALTAAERAFRASFEAAPDYRYERSGLPRVQPPPAPGACCKFGPAG